ncbi:2,3-butanediol dehydrogenase [Loigolactobacillus coryniformis]|uniref:2,3-butanediol dehydrogenase n=1 Tax=Loigolactobacillus coryniformis TaxID=1610 RepID=A0A5B8TFW2_9LACO|nr:2,3-butanediol dehydrogenase [Loigolactobacillus coryniformis]QEA52752.1 2,3-butanediol dehydrogenase [Loigolactobacillus coryniformis]RRG05264.1 MAG: butanediol dehydrogenase [Lactobacillus sp.]
MQAARIYGAKDIRIEDVPLTPPQADEVQLKVKYCGICGSDLHEYLEGWGLPTQPYPLTGQTLPVIEGHEFSGEIVAVGAAVTTLAVGDHVTVEPIIACGDCENCRKGQYNICLNAVAADDAGNFLGFSANGGFAEYATVKAAFTHQLPAGMSYELGALAEPTAVVYEAIKKSRLRAGQDIAILGAGPIGLLTAILAKIAGANHIFVIDVAPERLKVAEQLGFSGVFNPSDADVNALIRQQVPNGVDIAYEAAGVQPTFNTALKLIKRGGILQVIALFGKPITFDITNDVITEGIDIYTTITYQNSFPQVLGIIDNNRELIGQIITKKISLAQLIPEGILALTQDKSQVKILVTPE